MKTLTAFCLDWHIKQSDAFKDLLVEPLKSYANIRLTAWDGEQITRPSTLNMPLIFCMLPPPTDLLKTSGPIIWIPMWDQAQGYSDEWWMALPKSLKIVAFSDVIYQKAINAGLRTLRLQYFKDPNHFQRATWEKGRVLFYWNRVGLVGPDFIAKLCDALDIDTLLFKPDIDPRIEENKRYSLPNRIGKTKITILKTLENRDEFLRTINSANVVLSPRLTEGVGMVFIEAMARGCAIIAHNAPTMNEYISSYENGLLFDNFYHSNTEKLKSRFSKNRLLDNTSAPYLLTNNQPWRKIAKVNLNAIGDRAYADHVSGHQKWQKNTEQYAQFILNS